MYLVPIITHIKCPANRGIIRWKHNWSLLSRMLKFFMNITERFPKTENPIKNPQILRNSSLCLILRSIFEQICWKCNFYFLVLTTWINIFSEMHLKIKKQNFEKKLRESLYLVSANSSSDFKQSFITMMQRFQLVFTVFCL